jgi:hypothetical protein
MPRTRSRCERLSCQGATRVPSLGANGFCRADDVAASTAGVDQHEAARGLQHTVGCGEEVTEQIAIAVQRSGVLALVPGQQTDAVQVGQEARVEGDDVHLRRIATVGAAGRRWISCVVRLGRGPRRWMTASFQFAIARMEACCRHPALWRHRVRRIGGPHSSSGSGRSRSTFHVMLCHA